MTSSKKGRTAMRLRTMTLLSLLLVAGLAGCSDPKAKMSKYRYALEKINKRWVTVRKSFQSEKPVIYLCRPVLKQDFSELVSAMERSYKASNRDEVLPKLKALAKKYMTDIDAVVHRTPSGGAVLAPGATIEGVSEIVSKTYAEYQEIEKLVK
jgi:hypothetical protein